MKDIYTIRVYQDEKGMVQVEDNPNWETVGEVLDCIQALDCRQAEMWKFLEHEKKLKEQKLQAELEKIE